jgi:serine/threonine protein phosphatase PrpC
VAFDQYLNLVSTQYVKKWKKQDMLNRMLGVKGKSDFLLAGTCAAVVLVGPDTVTIANLGDSQVVSRSGRLTKLHNCHNPEEAHRILCNGGYILEDRLNGNLLPTRAFGDFNYKRAESTHKNILSCVPEVTQFSRRECGEFLVLGSDGIFDVMPETAVMKLCEEHAKLPVSQIAQLIVDKSIGLGSMDNVTCVVVKMAPIPTEVKEDVSIHADRKGAQTKAKTLALASLPRAMSAGGES